MVSPKRDIQRISIKHLWTVTCLRWTRLNKLGYWSLRAEFPNHLSFQNLVCFPLCTLNVIHLRKSYFTDINPDQNYESPDFFSTWVRVLDLTYLFLSISCQMPSSLVSLNNHLLKRHLFCTFKSIILSPPCSFNLHSISHLDNLYFFCDHPLARRI